MLIVDSREQWTQARSTDQHIRRYLDKHQIQYEIRKLDCGDYMLSENPTLAIDRKQSLEELARNLLNRSDSSRFWREVRRARESGVRLVVLCEHGGQIKSINDVPKWKSKYSPVHGRRLVDEMIRLELGYGIRWEFCDKRSTGRRIIEILTENVQTDGGDQIAP